MREFVEFATGATRGLAKAYTEDIDVFLLFTGGILTGTRSRPLRALGATLVVFTAYRRADQYVDVLNKRLGFIAGALEQPPPNMTFEHPSLPHTGAPWIPTEADLQPQEPNE